MVDEAERAAEEAQDVTGSSRVPVWRIIAGVLAALLLMVGSALIWLDSDSGHRFVARQIAALEFKNGLKVTIGRIDGSIYGEMTLRDIAFGDPAGVFLTAPEAQVNWRPFAYLSNRIDIRSIDAPALFVKRLPAFREVVSDEPLLPDIDIDVAKLELSRIEFDPAITGHRHLLSLSGAAHIADRRAMVSAKASAIAGGGLAGGDELALKLDAVPELNRLDIELDLNAPADGLLAGITGKAVPITAYIQGKGDWAQWDGQLGATFGGQELADLTLASREGKVTVKGRAHPGLVLPASVADIFAPATRIALSAALDRRRADIHGTIGNENFNLAANGLVDLGKNRYEELALDFRLLRPTAIAPNLRGEDVSATLALDGAFATPAVSYNLSAAQLGIGSTTIIGLSASGRGRVDADKASLPVHAKARRIAGLDAAAGDLLTNVRVDGDLAVKWPRLLSDNLRIRSDRVDAKAVLIADMSTGLFTGSLNGRVGNYRVAGVGRFDVASDLDLKTERDGFSIAGTVQARSREIFNGTVRDFLGGDSLIAANVSYGTDGIARISRLRVAAPEFRMTDGSGSYHPDGRISFKGQGISDRYGPLALDLSGTATRPVAIVLADRPGFGVGLADVRAELRGTPEGYSLSAHGMSDYGPFDADLSILAGTGPTTVDVRRADFAGVAFAGRIVQSASGPFTGTLSANGSGIGGHVELLAAGSSQRLLIAASASNAKFPGPAELSLARAIVNADITLFDQPQVTADVQVAGLTMEQFSLARARVQVDYRGGTGTAKLLAHGRRAARFEIAANVQMMPQLWRVALSGNAGGQAFRTEQPARIRPGEENYELLPTRLVVGDGSIQLAGRYGNDMAIQSRLSGVDLAVLRPVLPQLGLGGTASGSLDFAQVGSGFPSADARLTIKRFTRTSLAAVSQPADVRMVGRLLPDGGSVHAVLERNGTTIGRVQFHLHPLGPDSGTWTTRLLAAPLSGGIRYNGPASVLFSFAALPDQHLTGAIGVAADFTGRVQSPGLSGVVQADDLTYFNESYGTRLSKMRVRGTFTDDRLEVSELTATAGEGQVSGSGFVSLSSTQGYPLQLDLKLDNAQIAESDGKPVRATGTLAIINSAGEPAVIRGTVSLPETHYRIVRPSAVAVQTLTGIRRKSDGPAVAAQQGSAVDATPRPISGVPSNWRLEVDIAASDRIFITGMGLDSEWSANLRLRGTTGNPRMTGGIDLVRGTLDFANRSFELQSGRIRFNDGDPYNPTLTITAEGEVDDVNVAIDLEGSVGSPRISFSSTPALPQDEIMARILFGNSIGELSAIEAVQLAASLNALRTGSGRSPLGVLQSASGIDRLRFLDSDEASGRGAAVAVGQRITNDIYVEIVSDARGYTATQIEISLTSSLSLLSEVSSFSGSAVDIRYRKDY